MDGGLMKRLILALSIAFSGTPAHAAGKAGRAEALQATDAVIWLSRLPAFPRGFDAYGYEFTDPDYPLLYDLEHARHLECLLAVDAKRAFWTRQEDALPFES